MNGFTTDNESFKFFSFNLQEPRKYEHIATTNSNKNFSKVLEIAANANRCTRSGLVTQYIFKCIQKMSEDEIYDKLCQILNGDVTTVTRLNKAVANVQVCISSESRALLKNYMYFLFNLNIFLHLSMSAKSFSRKRFREQQCKNVCRVAYYPFALLCSRL